MKTCRKSVLLFLKAWRNVKLHTHLQLQVLIAGSQKQTGTATSNQNQYTETNSPPHAVSDTFLLSQATENQNDTIG